MGYFASAGIGLYAIIAIIFQIFLYIIGALLLIELYKWLKNKNKG